MGWGMGCRIEEGVDRIENAIGGDVFHAGGVVGTGGLETGDAVTVALGGEFDALAIHVDLLMGCGAKKGDDFFVESESEVQSE